MKSYVWDTGALSQFFVKNENTTIIMKDIDEGKSHGIVPQLVYSEFYYKTWQVVGETLAEIWTKSLRNTDLNEYILTENDSYLVGRYKINYSGLSIIDAIVVATAKSTNSIIVTTDGDFEKVKGIKVKKIEF